MPTERILEQKYIVGFDLRDDFCQMSYMQDPGKRPPKEPSTFSLRDDAEQFDIPTAIAKVIGQNRWASGQDAAKAAADGSSIYLPKLLSLALEGQLVQIENAQYEPTALLALFLSRCLALLGTKIPIDQVAALMFTARVMDQKTIAVLENVTKRLNLGCQVYYEGYANSYYNFMLMQAQTVREPASVLCEYEAGGQLRVEKLFFNLHTKPIVAYREEKIYPGLFGDTPSERDEAFAGIMKTELAGNRFSSVYLIGNGFAGDWLRTSVRLLCRGRRVFLGNNLYSKGAGYGGYFKLRDPEVARQYFFLDGNKLKTNIGIRGLVRGREAYCSIVDAGVNWYEAEGTCDLVLENAASVKLLFTPLTGGSPSEVTLDLDGLPTREDRTTRVRLSFRMDNPEEVTVVAKDLGFGEIFPSTGLSWEKKIPVGTGKEQVP